MKMLNLQELDYQEDSSQSFEYFRHLPMASLLDSCAMGHTGDNGRFDIITAEPSDIITVDHHGKVLWKNCLTGHAVYSDESPFAVLSHLLDTMPSVEDLRFPFTGGILGYWAYELGTLMELEKIQPRDESDSPLMCVGLFWWALITDHQLKTTTLICHPDIDPGVYSKIIQILKNRPEINSKPFKLTGHFQASMDSLDYEYAFDRIQDYILAGDCYEVNLTQEFSAPYSGDSWQAYRLLRQISPAPFSAFLSYADLGLNILSHSPERFIKVSGCKVETHPIKGTIARGKTFEQDIVNAQTLQSSEKDRSENLMIVDLLRNDLGKICETGSIRVPRLFALESYANVHHLVSSVTGILPSETCVFVLMASVFPGGSITGAPKIRSMEIIRELEPNARSVYCGSIGYISCNGKMDTNIAIRTLVDVGQTLHCWGGGAIVSESLCHQEYQESITKVSNLMSALEKNCSSIDKTQNNPLTGYKREAEAI